MKEFSYEEEQLFKSKYTFNLFLVKNITDYDANEKFLAIKKEENEIEIYEIPMNLDKTDSSLKEYGKIFCIIEPSNDIKEFMLNQNYFNILLVVDYQNISFFIIPENSQKNGIIEPRFVFEKKEAGFNSAVFNPFNSHIVACSCLNNTIQIWSVKQPILRKVECYSNAIKLKWRNCGRLLGFVDKNNILKIYDISIL